jgi:hypothetical protein
MGVVVADRAVDLAGQRYARQLLALAAQARDDVGQLLADGSRRCSLAVGAREHRQRGVRVGHRAQRLDDGIEFRQQHLLPRLVEHQRIGQVVDVLAGAGEMHELQRRLERRVAFQPFLEEVLDRLDVVVGGRLDLLDVRGVGDGEAVGERAQAADGVVVEGGQFGDGGLRRQRQQPFDLHTHAGADQPVLGEDRPQRVDLARIAAVERGQGEELAFDGVGHGEQVVRATRHSSARSAARLRGFPRRSGGSRDHCTTMACHHGTRLPPLLRGLDDHRRMLGGRRIRRWRSRHSAPSATAWAS